MGIGPSLPAPDNRFTHWAALINKMVQDGPVAVTDEIRISVQYRQVEWLAFNFVIAPNVLIEFLVIAIGYPGDRLDVMNNRDRKAWMFSNGYGEHVCLHEALEHGIPPVSVPRHVTQHRLSRRPQTGN